MSVLALLVCLGTAVSALRSTLPPVTWTPDGEGVFCVSADTPTTVYVAACSAALSDDDGLTLIPPCTRDFAHTFAEDLRFTFGSGFQVEVVDRFPTSGNRILLSVSPKEETEWSTYESGVWHSEGYELDVASDVVRVSGAGARGVWWGTRTLLQELVLARAEGREGACIKTGKARDSPAYRTRGFMLDAGRKWYSGEFLKEICTYASFFKLSEFHYHASDNYPLNRGKNATWQNVYSQFSLLPENPALQGLVQRPNEALSRAEFASLQSHCASRGITIIPELEAPGHALSITKWKPQLALADKKDLLNLTHPETIPTVKSIWTEFLPWFQTKEVHIGADEYDATLADDYIAFVNEMSDFISTTSQKQIRIWGTYEPSTTARISTSVIIQHWQYGQSDPVALSNAGYSIINSDDRWAYTGLKNNHVPISPAPYPQFVNITRMLDFADRKGWQWEPSLFNQVNITEQLAADSPRNYGAIMAAWNDNGPEATTQLEAFYAVRDGLSVFAARAWSGARGGKIDIDRLEGVNKILTASAPNQNLDRHLINPQKDCSNQQDPDPRLLLCYENYNYNDKTETLWENGSKGPNYTLKITYTSPFTLASSDSTLTLSRSSLTFTLDSTTYPLRSISQTDGYDPSHPGRIWSNATTSTHETVVTLPSEGVIVVKSDWIGGSRVWVDGVFLGRFEVEVWGGRNLARSWSQVCIVAPLDGASGGWEKVEVWEGLVGF